MARGLRSKTLSMSSIPRSMSSIPPGPAAIPPSTPALARAGRRPSAGEDVLRDDHALHLAGPFADLADLRVAQVALDVELAHVAVAAVDLERRCCRPASRPRSRRASPSPPLASGACPWSASHAARYVSSAAASSSVFASASIHWMAWKSAMGLPKALRSLAYARGHVERAVAEAERHRGDRDPPAVEDPHRVEKPWSTSPTRCASGTRTPSSVSSAVSLERQPSLSRCFDAREPRRPVLDDERGDAALLGRRRGSSARGRRRSRRREPCVMNVLVPLRTQSSPSRRAVVRSAAESLPLPGSVSAHAASHSPRGRLRQVAALLRVAPEGRGRGPSRGRCATRP